MFRIVVSGVLAVGLTSSLSAQTPPTGTNGTPPQLNPLLSTGTPVGTPLRSVGTPFQPVGQTPGAPLSPGQMPWRQDPIPPNGKLVDLRNSVAPVPAASLPPALRPVQPMSLWDQIYTTWATNLGLRPNNSPAQTGYVPGMTRRAKERKDKRWIWD